MKRKKQEPPKTILEILSKTPTSPYNTKAINEYSSQLQKMNLLEMQTHAIGLGIRPCGDRELLQKTLINLFKSNNSTLSSLVAHKDLKVKKNLTLLEIIKSGKK